MKPWSPSRLLMLIAFAAVAATDAGAQLYGSEADALRTPNTFEDFVARLEADYRVDIVQKAQMFVTDFDYYDATDRISGRILGLSFSPSVDTRRMERDMETDLRAQLGLPGLDYDDKALDACYSAAPDSFCGGRDAGLGGAAIIARDGVSAQKDAGEIRAAESGRGYEFAPYRP